MCVVGLLLAGMLIAVGSATESTKKGVSIGWAHCRCDDLTAPTGLTSPSWFYDWGLTMESFTECGCGSTCGNNCTAEYVPQFSSEYSLTNLSNHNHTLTETARFVMGYNEPDHSGSYIKPKKAATDWANMELLQDLFGFEIIGPCLSNYDSGKWWYKRWQQNCTELYGRPCRMNYTCTHCYYEPGGVDSMMASLADQFNDYGLPIWITEFACPPYKNCSAADQLTFMQDVMPLLDNTSYIDRYAWFIARYEKEGKDGCTLLEANSSVRTPLGDWYNAFESTAPDDDA